MDERQNSCSDQLTKDLRRLYQPPSAVPRRVDQAILAHAHRHLRPRTRIWLYRIAAAAAVLLIAVGLVFMEKAGTRPMLSGDIDHSGSVNILDALQLARRIEDSKPLEPRWDLNGDGIVDRKDVDAVGYLAVRLDRREVM